MNRVLLFLALVIFFLPGTSRGQEAPTFNLVNADIVSWQESGGGKYIYLTLTPEKDAEFAALTKSHTGENIAVVLEGIEIAKPEIVAPIPEGAGFALSPGDGGLTLLDPEKKTGGGHGASVEIGAGAGGG
ncbi:MAG: hypothetical protein HY370_00030 [Proteobacteria bacterium]|nr:hypothetical protein [Pseudomonadota bacterium]